LRKRERRGSQVYYSFAPSVAAAVLTFSLLALYSEPRCVELYANTLTVLAAGASFWASLRVLERQKLILYEPLRASWFYVSTGLGLWLVAEALRLAHIALLGGPPGLSAADVARALGYALVLAGLYRGVKPLSLLTRGADLGYKARLAYAIPPALGAPLIAAALAEIPEAVAEEGLLTAIVGVSYVVLDAALLTLSLKAVAFFWRGRFVGGPALLSLGLALLAVSDLPYSAVGGYYPGNPLDMLRAISYMVMAAGIYAYSRQPPVI